MPKKGESTDVLDRQQNLTIDDFRDLNKLDKVKKPDDGVVPTAALGAPPIPDIAQVLAAPHAPKVANTKLVTIAVTEDVPLRDVLFELGRLAKVDIEVGSGLDTTGINLRATDQPFNEVIERIAHLAKLRYSVNGNAIRIERDLPYIKNYSLDFLNLVRSSNSTYNLSTNILSGGSGGGGGAGGGGGVDPTGGLAAGGGAGGSSGGTGFGTTGSTNNITSQGESDLFSSLEASLNEILNYQSAGGAPATASADGGPSLPAPGGGGNFVVNRQSNVLTVNATDAQHEMIARFLALLSRNSSAQVLIEAKVVEVSLADEFSSGVNWNEILGGSPYLGLGRYSASATTNIEKQNISTIGGANQGVSSNAVTFGVKSGDLNAVIQATQRFGSTRTLSSPRLSAINNQQAVLTFARNEVYFNCTATPGELVANTSGQGTTATQPTVSCNQQTVPIGVIMNILPSVNLNTQEVTLNVRPTLTRVVTTVDNPSNRIAAQIANAGCDSTKTGCIDVSKVNSAVPVIEVRELDSVMKVKSGGVMIIGGLMEDTTRNVDTGVPGLNEVPFLGNLFKSRSEDSLKRELIIFIKATIVSTDGSAQPADRKIYDKYVTDPRPLFPK